MHQRHFTTGVPSVKFTTSSRRINTLPLALIAIEDVLVDQVAFLLVKLRRVGPWEVVEDCLDRRVNVGTGPLFLSPVEDQLRFLLRFQQGVATLP